MLVNQWRQTTTPPKKKIVHEYTVEAPIRDFSHTRHRRKKTAEKGPIYVWPDAFRLPPSYPSVCDETELFLLPAAHAGVLDTPCSRPVGRQNAATTRHHRASSPPPPCGTPLPAPRLCQTPQGAVKPRGWGRGHGNLARAARPWLFFVVRWRWCI